MRSRQNLTSYPSLPSLPIALLHCPLTESGVASDPHTEEKEDDDDDDDDEEGGEGVRTFPGTPGDTEKPLEGLRGV